MNLKWVDSPFEDQQFATYESDSDSQSFTVSGQLTIHGSWHFPIPQKLLRSKTLAHVLPSTVWKAMYLDHFEPRDKIIKIQNC